MDIHLEKGGHSMNGNRNVWQRTALALVAACFLVLLALAALMALPSVSAQDPPDQDNLDLLPALVSDTGPYTIYLPLVLNPPCPYQSPRPSLQGTANFAGEVEILTPRHCTTGFSAEMSIIVSGTYTRTPANVILWVLAYAPNSLYYVQSPDACNGEPPYQVDGYWQVPAYLGLKGGAPEWFDLVVVLTDEETSQFLSNVVRQGCQSGIYIGITAAQLNQMAITEKDFISVQTLD
jgi:hypothetical protein